MLPRAVLTALWPLLLFSSSSSGCADRSDVALTALLGEPRATLTAGPFGAAFSGSTVLELELGEHAQAVSSVSVEALALKAANGDVLLELQATPAVAFPIILKPGTKARVPLELGTSTEVTPAAQEALCGQSVRYAATLADGAFVGRALEAPSVLFQPSCL